jgi:hypothetical protein
VGIPSSASISLYLHLDGASTLIASGLPLTGTYMWTATARLTSGVSVHSLFMESCLFSSCIIV